MANARVAYVTAEVINWARKLDDIQIEDVAKSTGVSVEKIISWESGESLPSVNQAKKLAKKYRVPFVYFYLPSIPTSYKLPKNRDYRTFYNIAGAGQIQSREMAFLLRDIMSRRDIMIDLYNELGKTIMPFDSIMDADENNIISASAFIRNLVGLTMEKQKSFRKSNVAYNYYLDAFSKMGILVFQAADIDPHEMRGLSVYDPKSPIIVVNRKDEYNARIFTLFHELVHLLTRTPGICDNMNSFSTSVFDIEILCNKIAAQALVPRDLLENNVNFVKLKTYGWDDDYIRLIAKDFSVSREVVIGRLAEIVHITLNFYNEKLKQFSDEYKGYLEQQKIKKKDGFLPPSTDICSQVGKPYAHAVIDAYNQELITPRAASGYLSGLRIQHFDKVERWCL